MSLYFITGNIGKFEEAKSIIPSLEHLDIDLPEIQSIDPKEIIKAKLTEALQHKDREFVVEDVSVHFDCLNGLPGPFIKWFLQSLGNDGLFELTQKYNNEKAKVVAHLGYARSLDEIYFFEGEIQGSIVKPAGEGFGWDPIFKPKGYTASFGELDKKTKNEISMRSIVFNKLKGFLEN